MARAVAPTHFTDVQAQVRNERTRVRYLFVASLVLTLVTGLIAHATAPEAFSLAFLVLVLSCITAFAWPAAGLYLIVFLSMVGDSQTTPWWPFTKNMSSRESIFFVHNSLTITPLEVLLGVTCAAFLMHAVADRNWHFHRGRMFFPVMVFTAFVLMGFLRGTSAGDRRVAIFEVRPLIYFAVIYVLMTNVIKTREQYRGVFAFAIVGVSIQCLFSLNYYRTLPAFEREVIESLSEHSASLTMNVIFLFLFLLIVFGGARWRIWGVAALSLPVLYAYLLSQRRAGMIALFAGFIIAGGVLYHRNRRLFWRISPPIVVLGLMFIVATWNAQGALGLPAAGVKSAFFPDSLSENDLNSSLYRETEAYNLWFTIRQSPITGLGFGRQFLVVAPLPDISFFEFWQYIPHNSVLWVWIKTGYFGFVAMLFMFARTVQRGSRAALRVGSPDDAAIVVCGLCYVIMFLVFAYVDIAWDIRPAIFLAVAFALCADFERAAEEPTVSSERTARVTQLRRVPAAAP